MIRFVPGPDSQTDFREALGAFATGVTVVTCRSSHGPLGITANSFSSVSLDPPLVLWCPAKSSSRFDAFVRAKRFAIHVLRRDQQPLCRRFASEGLAFEGLDWREDAAGVPELDGCLARFECASEAVHDAGDHAIVVGLVLAVTRQRGEPLIFAGGRYGGVDLD
ncbi:flavin reductase [Silicimonas algicola]|uniref:Flavin reductase (DIM6/NTAB) family NADH-FMN oxidoreductase RutF n=1 Tax=Silicimonas algicola TaxID=1826607 RepID=A0A316GEK0_9RHOB|nr:flavin reductase family protein [Silicimonas algicola]AZQ67792.1 flavin reductase [Silicimonas algicola]PWK57790.1 flavin reductase (DIM6/NTAB) family NADH-FMN oxidoreductase RutF [Silicimonas algicola]